MVGGPGPPGDDHQGGPLHTTTTRRPVGRLALGLAVAGAILLAACTPVTPPKRPSSGPGSTASYISSGATELSEGSGTSGTRVWWYVPKTLKGGSSAPVVVLLHGFMLLAPDIYRPMIDHYTRQGIIVIYPQFNKGGFDVLSDTDQNAMLTKAIAGTNLALSRLGAKADTSKLYLFGHSLGGLLASVWQGAGGPTPKGIVLANPSTDASVGMPDFVKGLVNITPIPYTSLVGATTAPTVVLTGDADTIAPSSQSVDLWNRIPSAAARSVFQARSDDHGKPALTADHMSPIQDSGIIPGWLMGTFGGDAEDDAMDWRFYESALDQMLAGTSVPTFDMGTWSDGVAVKAPVRLK